MADLNQLPVEELAAMPDWLIPPSRKAEVEVFKARKRRGVTEKSVEEEQQEIKDARRRAGLEADGSRTQRFGAAAPQPKTGRSLHRRPHQRWSPLPPLLLNRLTPTAGCLSRPDRRPQRR